MGHIEVLGTGGTIASRQYAGATGVTAGDSVELIASKVRTKVDVRFSDVMTEGSYRLTLRQLRQIVEEITARTSDPDVLGVVVTHGTDTVEETSYLAHLVHDRSASLVFTGAQREASSADSDGPRNLQQAVEAAADPAFRRAGATVAFAGELISARGLRKAETIAPSPFSGLVRIATYAGNQWDQVANPKVHPPLPALTPRFDVLRVPIHLTYPGSSVDEFARYLDARCDGVVLAGTGVGNAGIGYAEIVAEFSNRRIPVVLASRAWSGPILGIYGNGGGADLIANGAIPSGQLSPFQARILLLALLSAEYDYEVLKSQFSSRVN